MLRRGWTAGTAQLIPLMHLVIRLSHGKQVNVLQSYWEKHRPDMVVSLIPHYNRALKITLDRVWPGTPFVTLLTDIADYPPHFWIERVDQHVICGSQMAARQAMEIGIPKEHVLLTSGMILHPRFYAPLDVNRRAERMRRGLRPDLPTGLVMFGGEGSTEMLRIAKALNREDSGFQLILLCGKNEELADQLRGLNQRIPMFVRGFTRDVPLYMEISDFFIGKPGPGSISEALAKQLPVIVQRNAWTLAHERYNADWVEEMGVGLAVRDFTTDLEGAVRTMLAPAVYERFRARAAEMRNSAVFEIPHLLEGILSDHPPQRDSASSTSRLPFATAPR
jgi:1,2-diacylglycerol 3-beta-galactosyltransferase